MYLSPFNIPTVSKFYFISSFQFTAQSCPTLCSPMHCSMTVIPVGHQLLELAQTHVQQSMMPSTISFSVVSFFSCLQSFPASGTFSMSQFFTSGGQSIGVAASASVLPVNIQDWFPLELTGLISLLSKGLSRVFSKTKVQKHQFFGTQLFYGPTLIFIHDYWENHSFH